MDPGPSHRHHELPKLYLKGFWDSKSRSIWVYTRERPFCPGSDAQESNPCLLLVKDAAMKWDRYAYQTSDGMQDTDTFERRLQREEIKADHALKKVRSLVPVTIEDKETLAGYIQVTMKRVSTRERVFRPHVKDIIEAEPWADLVWRLASSGRFKDARQASDYENYMKSEEGGVQFFLNETILDRYPHVHALLMKRNWRFCVAPKDNHFVTTDFPTAYDTSVGLSKSPLVFPISKKVALVISDKVANDLEYCSVSPDFVAAINYWVIRSFSTEVYSHQADQKTLGIHQHMLGLSQSEWAAFSEL